MAPADEVLIVHVDEAGILMRRARVPRLPAVTGWPGGTGAAWPCPSARHRSGWCQRSGSADPVLKARSAALSVSSVALLVVPAPVMSEDSHDIEFHALFPLSPTLKSSIAIPARAPMTRFGLAAGSN